MASSVVKQSYNPGGEPDDDGYTPFVALVSFTFDDALVVTTRFGELDKIDYTIDHVTAQAVSVNPAINTAFACSNKAFVEGVSAYAIKTAFVSQPLTGHIGYVDSITANAKIPKEHGVLRVGAQSTGAATGAVSLVYVAVYGRVR